MMCLSMKLTSSNYDFLKLILIDECCIVHENEFILFNLYNTTL